MIKKIYRGLRKKLRPVRRFFRDIKNNLRFFFYALNQRLLFNKKPHITHNNESLSFPEHANRDNTVAVIMCVWKRLEKLPVTFEQIAKQEGVQPVLYLWNNNINIAEQVDELVKESTIPVKVKHSRNNVGGFGRFYYARELADDYDKFIFIDDDQEFESDAIKSFIEEYEPKTICSYWGYRINNPKRYWDRYMPEPGERIKYAATGGMVCDSSVFKKEELFNCPKEYWFIEDLWLSYYAEKVLGWKLYKSHVSMYMESDERDQSKTISPYKNNFLKYLVRKKDWNIFDYE